MAKTILVVEDSPSFRQIVQKTLEKHGYAVLSATDGVDACSKIVGHKIDMIVCDINMPRMDGLTFVRHLKETEHKFVPVVMVTTEGQPEVKEQGRALGVKGWIMKPFELSTLVRAVEKFCGQ